MSEALDRLEALLGDPVFWVPVHSGTKVPAVTYTNRPYAATRSDAYREMLRGDVNLAVYLGSASGGLCAIDFDDEDDLIAFMQVNPALRGALLSRAARGGQVWVRIDGDYPASCKTNHFEWRADRNLSMIHGVHPSGVSYHIDTEAPPARLAFEDIVWPEDWTLPWVTTPVDELMRVYGEPLKVNDKGRVTWNQAAFCKLFLEANDLIWSPEGGAFYLYDADRGLWVSRDETTMQKVMADAMVDMIQKVRDANPEAPLEDACGTVTANTVRDMTRLTKAFASAEGAFDTRDTVVHAANGMVDIRRRPFSLEPFAARWMSRNQIGVPYDPGADCPMWRQTLLNHALPDPDDQSMLQRFFGLVLTGHNDPQVIMMLVGNASTGKGTIVSVLMHLIGRENGHELRTRHLQDRFEVGYYWGKTLLYGPDVDAEFLNTPAAGSLKKLTGHDLIFGEVKGSRRSLQMKGDFNVVITCNSRPSVKLEGDADAWARRLRILQFDGAKPENPIRNFDRLLIEKEGPGILNWALEGVEAVLDDMAACRGFVQTEAQAQRVQSLLSESDSVRNFVDQCLRRSPFESDNVTSEELYLGYLALCENVGWTPEGRKRFTLKVTDVITQQFGLHPTKFRRSSAENGSEQFRGYRNLTMAVPDANPGELEPYSEPF